MKKRTGISVLVLISIIIITAFSGCSADFWSGSDEFIFADEKGSETKISPEEILNYTPTRPDAVGEYMKSKLSDNDLYIYNAVSYAVDNGCTDIKIPEEYGSKDPETYVKAITFYSCDSPFLEHNYTTDGTFRLTEVTLLGDTFYGFTLPRNTAAFSAEKQKAYEKAKDIVSDIPKQYISDEQKMKYLYEYITKNIKYAKEVNSYNYSTVPIYDALLTDSHETICDGFVDTLMLLLNMVDIECFAVEGINNKNTGHVVVCARLGGKYFYFDPTNDANVYEGGFKPGFYYALSDKELKSYFKEEDDFSGQLPICPVNRLSDLADVVAFNADDDTVEKVESILQRDGSVNVYFTDIVSEDDRDNFGRKLASAVGDSIVNTKANGIIGYAKQ